MPKISVICVTARPGGLDVLLTGLKNQTFQDFELVLVDALWHRRHSLVLDAAADAGVSICHIPPKTRIFPKDDCPSARNTALARARGYLIYWLVDYSFPQREALEAHWKHYEDSQRVLGGAGGTIYLFPPKPAYRLPDYAPMKRFPKRLSEAVTYDYRREDSEAYYNDLMAGVYDRFMYSVFEEPIVTPEQVATLSEDHLFYRVDPKVNGKVGGLLHGNFFHAKSESIGRDRCLMLNGFDESYTGHCYDDTDFGHRAEHLSVKLDTTGRQFIKRHIPVADLDKDIHNLVATWRLLPPQQAAVFIVNPRHFFPHLVLRDSIESKKAYYEARQDDFDVVQAPNPYELASLAQLDRWWYV